VTVSVNSHLKLVGAEVYPLFLRCWQF